jgi:mxaJ protein
MRMRRITVSLAMHVALAGFFGFISFISFGALARSSSKTATSTTWELRVCADGDDLPYSNKKQQGFENRIATLLAQDLHAKLSYLWLPKLQNASRNLLWLRENKCDLFLDDSNLSDPYLATLAYYQSTYVFVYRADAPFKVTSLDDAVLKKLRIGVESMSPPDPALGARGLVDNLHHYNPVLPTKSAEAMIDDVVNGKLDLAVVWGPVAGYYALKRSVKLEVVPVTPQVDTSGLSTVYATSMGLREGDTDLRDVLNQALADEWAGIQKVLKEYNVPTIPLPKPAINVGG